MLSFEANSGQNPRMGFELRKKGKYEGAARFMERMKEEAKATLAKAQEDIKKYANRHRCQKCQLQAGIKPTALYQR